MTTDMSETVPRRTGIARNEAGRGAPVDLCYEEFGAQTDPAVLLIMGWGGQMLIWPSGFCEQLAARGFRVVRFDNRDIGESTKFRGEKARPVIPSALRMLLGSPGRAPAYDLRDMTLDAVSVLDHLRVERAHVVGMSMGGMIGQILVAENPGRAASFGAIFTSMLRPFVVFTPLKGLPALFTKLPAQQTREEAIAHARQFILDIGGSISQDPAEQGIDFGAVIDRGKGDASGMARQFDAILGTGSLVGYAKRISRPTVVIHGTEDPLIRLACGKDLAKTIPGAKLRIVPTMGHAFPEPVWGILLEELTANFARAV